MNALFDCARIAGIAAAVPTQTRQLSEFAAIWGENEVARIIAATGVSCIREAPAGMTTADLCAEAATRLLVELKVDPGSIDGIVFVSQTPDHPLPATSALLQHRLGLPTRIAAFDINYGCSGYVYGLLQAHLLIHAGMCSSVLVCAGDVSTSLISPRDRSLRMLFGDAGSATLVCAGTERSAFSVHTDGSGAAVLIVPAGAGRHPRNAATAEMREAEEGNFRSAEHLYMDGTEVMHFALKDVPAMIEAALELRGWSKNDPGLYALHQANRFMVDYLRRKMRLQAPAVPFACEDIGNTGPASIPVMLAREHTRLAAEGRLEKTIMCGFGVGLSVAAATLSLADVLILDVIEVTSPPSTVN